MIDIHDIKPILPIHPETAHPLWIWAVALLLLLAAATLLWAHRRRRRPRMEATFGPPADPAEKTLAGLDRLTTQPAMAPRDFCFHLSALLRTYLHNRFAIPAPLLTAEELLHHLTSLDLPPERIALLEAYFRVAIPIQFGQTAAERGVLHEQLAMVRRFVEETGQAGFD